MRFVNDLDMDGDMIYFVDSSYVRGINGVVEEHLEAQPRGRLFSFNEKTGQMETLLQDLYLPDGLQLLPTKEAVLINENPMARILKSRLIKLKFGFFNFINYFFKVLRKRGEERNNRDIRPPAWIQRYDPTIEQKHDFSAVSSSQTVVS